MLNVIKEQHGKVLVVRSDHAREHSVVAELERYACSLSLRLLAAARQSATAALSSNSPVKLFVITFVSRTRANRPSSASGARACTG